MKKEYFSVRVVVMSLFILMILIIGITQIKGDHSESLFPMKIYEDLEPYGGYPKIESMSRYQMLVLDKQGLKQEAKMVYMSKPLKGRISGDDQVIINIKLFKEESSAGNYLMISLYEKKEYIEIKEVGENNLIFMHSGKTGKIYNYYWLSGNKVINVAGYLKKINDIPNQLLKDFLYLHPVTFEIKKTDIDIQNIINTQIDRSHDIICEADKMRILPARLTPGLPRAEAYIGMVAQCMAEFSIRCWTGMYDGESVDCPITFIENDIKRNKEWKEFKSEYMSRPVVEKNIVLDSISYAGSPTCAFRHEDVEEGTDPSDMWSIVMDELNMEYKELRVLSLTGEEVPSAFIRK